MIKMQQCGTLPLNTQSWHRRKCKKKDDTVARMTLFGMYGLCGKYKFKRTETWYG